MRGIRLIRALRPGNPRIRHDLTAAAGRFLVGRAELFGTSLRWRVGSQDVASSRRNLPTVTARQLEPTAAPAASSAPHQPTTQSKCAVVASAVTHGILVVCLGLISVSAGLNADREGELAAAFQDDVEQFELELVATLLKPADHFDDAAAGGQDAAFALLAQREPAAIFRRQSLTSSDFPVEQSAWSTADLSRHVGGTSKENGAARKPGSGTGDGDAAGDGSGNGFFGETVDGRRFVFVLDCSRSMNHPHASAAKTRFKRLKLELVRSVAAMSAEQEFFFVFFNDGPIAMPSTRPVPASIGAKQHYLSWMQTLKADGNTEPTTAMQIALRLQPDVIYFLTDGSFIHKTQLDLLRLPFGKTQLHTFAFEEVFEGNLLEAYRLLIDGERDAARDTISSTLGFRKAERAADSVGYLKRLAERHNGTFHLIPHSE